VDRSSFFYVANWKMQFTFDQALSFCENNKKHFLRMASQAHSRIILCPSFDVLHSIASLFKDALVAVGAQTCSAYGLGAYTGEVAAESLAQAGATYCIVGHSERRGLCAVTDEIIARKIAQLLSNEICPIICVGESRSEYEAGKTQKVISRQLKSACEAIVREKGVSSVSFCVAYEPIWSIGTGDIPSEDYLYEIFEKIKSYVIAVLPDADCTLLYGGSVNENNIDYLKGIEGIGGFLIGGASLDFQKFEKIVT